MESIRKVYQYANPNLTLVGWMGFLGFPTYYWVWRHLFPQSYENLPLRLLCSALFLLLVLRERLPMPIRTRMPIVYLIVITTCLPFFFFFMLLMNEWSNVWVMSFMAAIFLHILLVHMTKVMFSQTFIGVGMAVLAAYVCNDYHLVISVDWRHVPIFLFIYLFGNLFYFRNQVEHESRISIAKAFGAGIAHEMRNPLSGLVASIDVIQSVIPNDKVEKRSNYALSAKDVALLREVSEEAMKIIHSGNETIDLLLTSIDENRVSRSTFKRHSANEVVKNAIESFSYKKSADRQCIRYHEEGNFDFFGSHTLLKYVIYNLVKNAFNYRNPEVFTIDITISRDDTENMVVVRDNGQGIAPASMEHIFKDFYTTGKSSNYGLGLPFCKKVMRSFGGSIACQSAQGQWTEFTLTFPLVKSKVVGEIKYELMKLKSVFFISEQEILCKKMAESARSSAFALTVKTAEQACLMAEHEFEYDLIFLDLSSVDLKNSQLDRLESLLHFTEARIVYLYQDAIVNRRNQSTLPVLWVETQSWLLNTAQIIDRLMFDANFDAYMPAPVRKSDDGKRVIMVVDDNDSLRKFTSLLLEKQGFEVIQREDGREALHALEKHHVDLILMDIEMPILDGIEASIQIRQSNKKYAHVPIIAHTGDSTPVTLERINQSGMSDYLVKPADKNKLLDKISHWI
ncbi:hybrid sensor histidine kinase/response regulator [Vibrio cidicii]|uniref:histidine kinase n=1 Tax=Vibrio cidicii TaxID=1763883 RepID=A0ABR5W6L3_9VIBR|nr:hybrid sensor histidine kinase/response regulator [Vibrio cidicii]KYN90837.1 hybrid sensor histidine kinase/response regulator [Vibrio cidicii]